jgi:hypothetical protein
MRAGARHVGFRTPGHGCERMQLTLCDPRFALPTCSRSGWFVQALRALWRIPDNLVRNLASCR